MIEESTELSPALAWAALGGLCEAAAIKDDELRYVWVNEAFCTLLDCDPTEVLGRNDADLFPDSSLLPAPERERSVLRTGRADERYETMATANGDHREVLITTSLVAGSTHLIQLLHDITELVNANLRLVATTEHLTAESVELRVQAMVDPLTNTLNLRGFEGSAQDTLRRAGADSSMLMLDIDDFKATNDAHGHATGDEALRIVADAIRGATRRERDLIARVGGDEFIAVLPGTRQEEACSIAERIQRLITERAAQLELQVPPTVSIGLAAGSAAATQRSLNEWRQVADGALYEAKRRGKSRTATATLD